MCSTNTGFIYWQIIQSIVLLQAFFGLEESRVRRQTYTLKYVNRLLVDTRLLSVLFSGGDNSLRRAVDEGSMHCAGKHIFLVYF